MCLSSNSFTSPYQTCTAVVQSGVPLSVYVVYKLWATSNRAGIESWKCRSEFHKLPLALLHSVYRLASSYEAPFIFTWPVRYYPHWTMISTALPFSGPTALAVALAGCCTVPTSLNVHLMYRSYVMTAGQDRPCCYLRFLPAEVKTAIPTVWQEILFLFLNVTRNAT